MKTYLLQLEPYDDVISTRDKMTWSKAPRILLILPRRRKILQRRVDLALVQRMSRDLGAQLALVARDAEVRVNARELGIPVFRSPKAAQKAAWTLPRQKKVFKPRPDWHPALPGELRARQAELHPRLKTGIGNLVLRIAIFTIGIMAFFALAFFFYPSSKVIFSPLEQDQAVDLPLWASPEITALNPAGGIPARVETVEVEARVEGAASGTMLAPQGYAGGTVLLTNLTANPVELPAGIVLMTAGIDPIRFMTTDAVSLPGIAGATAEAAVQAQQPGSAANILPGEIAAIEGSAGLIVSVTNQTAFAGGNEVSVRAPDDRDAAALQTQLIQELNRQALDMLKQNLPKGETALPVSLQQAEILEDTREPAEGQPADRLALTRKAVISAWVVRNEDIHTAASTVLNANIPAGFHPIAGSLTLEPEGEYLRSGENVLWQVRARQRVQADWSPDQVIALVRGKIPVEAVEDLSEAVPLDAAVEIVTLPNWWPRLPFLPFRISLEVQ